LSGRWVWSENAGMGMRTCFLTILNRPVSPKLAAGIIAVQLLGVGLSIIHMADAMYDQGQGEASVTIQMQMPISQRPLGRATAI